MPLDYSKMMQISCSKNAKTTAIKPQQRLGVHTIVMFQDDAEMQEMREKMWDTVHCIVPDLVQHWQEVAMDSDSGLLTHNMTHFKSNMCNLALDQIDPILAEHSGHSEDDLDRHDTNYFLE